MANEFFDIRLRLTEKERSDLEVVLEQILETFDFHSDLTDMRIPVDKLLEHISIDE